MIRTVWHRLASWPRGRLIAVGIFLFLGLVYWGYCWGWWGRTNLVLQYLFQCRCPAASEEVRYRPFTVLASACRHPVFFDASPNGRYVVFAETHPSERVLLLDLETYHTRTLPLEQKAVNRIRFVTDQLVLVRLAGYTSRYILLDWEQMQQVRPAVIERYQALLDTTILNRARAADTVVAMQRETVILVRDYTQHPDQNLVIYAIDAPGQAAIAQQLTQTGIDFTQVKPRTAAGAVLDAAYSPDGRFWANDTGIYLSRTGARLIATGVDHGYRPMRFWPVSWVRANHAALYARGATYVIDLGTGTVFPGRFFRVPQPLLLLEIPAEYRE